MKKKLFNSLLLGALTLGLVSNGAVAAEIGTLSTSEESREISQVESSETVISEQTSAETSNSDVSNDSTETTEMSEIIESSEAVVEEIPNQEERFEYIQDPLKQEELSQNRGSLARAATASGVSMYRLYNPNNYEHFYTASKAEKDYLVKIGWGKYEGIGWTAPTSGDKVYRLYNKTLRDHHYTMDWNEVSVLTKKHGWTYEGEAWKSNKNKKQPVYRLFHPGLKSGSHHYTLSTNERDTLKKRGWKYEGVAWYAGADTGSTPKPTPPAPIWKYTVFYEGYETNSKDIKPGKHVFDTKAKATAWIDKYADGLLINQNISARRYGVQDWKVN